MHPTIEERQYPSKSTKGSELWSAKARTKIQILRTGQLPKSTLIPVGSGHSEQVGLKVLQQLTILEKGGNSYVLATRLGAVKTTVERKKLKNVIFSQPFEQKN